MSATVQRLKQARESEGRITNPSTGMHTPFDMDWEVQSVFYPELTVRPRDTRRCTHCGYHGPMKNWFGHHAEPWLILAGLIIGCFGPGLAVLFYRDLNTALSYFISPEPIGAVLLVAAIFPVAAFVLKYFSRYKCPTCRRVDDNH